MLGKAVEIQTYRDSETSKSAEANKAAFEYICAYTDENILASEKVERLSMLGERYLQHIYLKA